MGLRDWHNRNQSTAPKTITPVTETWEHAKRVLLFPRWLSPWNLLSRVQPEPDWLLCLWDSPGKNTAAGNHSLPKELSLGLLLQLRAGSVSHQDNSNQQKKHNQGTCLPISEAWVPSVGSENSGLLICLGSEKSVRFICSAVSYRPSCLC